MALTQCCSAEKYGSGARAETLRSGDAGGGIEEHRHGMVKDDSGAWYCRSHSGAQILNGQLKKMQTWSQATLVVLGLKKNKEIVSKMHNSYNL